MENYSIAQITINMLPLMISSFVTLIGMFFGFREFNKAHALKSVEVKAEAANDNAIANTTMFDLYERMLNNRMTQDEKFLEMHRSVIKLQLEVEALQKDYEREKERGDKFEKKASYLQEQFDDERQKRLVAQDARDDTQKELADLRNSINLYNQANSEVKVPVA